MRTLFLALLFSAAVAVAVFGGLMILLATSGLEAQFVNVGTLLGRPTPEPRVATVHVGVVALALSGALLVAFVLRVRGSGRRARPDTEAGTG